MDISKFNIGNGSKMDLHSQTYMEQYVVCNCYASIDQILSQLQVNVSENDSYYIHMKLEESNPHTVYVFLLKEGGLLTVTSERGDNVPRL